MILIREDVVVTLSAMDKQTRRELVRKGIYVLRSQYNSKKNCYMIVKATNGGGWSHFGSGWYITGTDAETKIDEIVSRDPINYRKDN